MGRWYTIAVLLHFFFVLEFAVFALFSRGFTTQDRLRMDSEPTQDALRMDSETPLVADLCTTVGAAGAIVICG